MSNDLDVHYVGTVRAFADACRHRAEAPVIARPAAAVLHGLPLLGTPPRYVRLARCSTPRA
ncbi:MAG TPA: hypothetical protein VIK12_00190 [Pengzhenrongella sp.]